MNPSAAFTIGVLVGIAAVVWTGLALMWRQDRHASIRSAPVPPVARHRPVRVIRNTRPADPTRAEFDAIIAHTWRPTQGGGE